MVKVFISQPMFGRTQEEIEDERDTVFADIACQYAEKGENCQEIPSYFGPKAEQLKPLELLGKSLELMAHADVAVFCKGWWKARGCRIEHDCARQYGIEVIELL